jgi:hypothetical protein
VLLSGVSTVRERRCPDQSDTAINAIGSSGYWIEVNSQFLPVERSVGRNFWKVVAPFYLTVSIGTALVLSPTLRDSKPPGI